RRTGSWGCAACGRIDRPLPQSPRSWKSGSFLALLLLETALEPLDLTSGINQALLASKEGMAHRTDVDVEVVFGRARLPAIAAATRDGGQFVLRMDARFHGEASPLRWDRGQRRVHADALALLGRLLEPHGSVNQSKQGVIAAYSDVAP